MTARFQRPQLAGAASRVVLSADRSAITAKGRDLAFITGDLQDANGVQRLQLRELLGLGADLIPLMFRLGRGRRRSAGEGFTDRAS